jgi:hypothetical protein
LRTGPDKKRRDLFLKMKYFFIENCFEIADATDNIY